MNTYFLIFCTGFFATLLLTPLAKKLAVIIGALDSPGERKVHRKVMPRLGGAAIFAAYLLTVLLFVDISREIQGLLLSGFMILSLGIIDDIRGISPRLKLAGQVLAALVAVYFGVKITFVDNPFDGLIRLGVMTIPISVLWMVGVTNALNLIDGLDGLATGVSAIALLAFSVIALTIGQTAVSMMSFALAACLFAFLHFNFFPAKIFLGDSGSMFLGFSIASLAIYGLLKGVTMIAFIIPVIILGVPIFDTAFAIVRRYLQKTPIFQADKKHIHHKLLSYGFSHRQVVMIIYLVSIFFSAGAVWMSMNYR